MPITILEERPRRAEMVRGTVLFADLRGYTTLAESLRPVSVVGLLDEFFSILAEAIEGRGGTVFHSAGDSIMAGFGLSDLGAGPVHSALDAGRRIVAAFAPVSERWQRRLGVATGVGVGLNVGELALTELQEPASARTTEAASVFGNCIPVTILSAAAASSRPYAWGVVMATTIAPPPYGESAPIALPLTSCPLA